MNNPFLQPPPPVFARGQWEFNYLGIPNYLQQKREALQQQPQPQPARPPQSVPYPTASQYPQNMGNPYADQYPDPGNPFLNHNSPYAAPQTSTGANVGTTTSIDSHHRRPASPTLSSQSTTSLATTPTAAETPASIFTLWPTRETNATGLGLGLTMDSALGHRHEPDLPRGVYMSSGEGGAQWQLAIEKIIAYKFANADLLEEALESPDSGVTCIGDSHRHLGREGNKGLASVGTKVMELVLMDAAYVKKMSEEEAKKSIERLTHRVNLERVGKLSKIERFVRRRKSEVKKNTQVLRMLKEDIQFEDPSRTIARAVRAILGAVYFDGGLDGVRRVLRELGLVMT